MLTGGHTTRASARLGGPAGWRAAPWGAMWPQMGVAGVGGDAFRMKLSKIASLNMVTPSLKSSVLST